MACNTPESTSQVDSVIPFPQYDMYYISGHPALRFASDLSTPFCRLATSSRFLFLKSSAGRTQLKLCKLEKETLAIRNASRRSLLDSSTLALRNATKTLGKERLFAVNPFCLRFNNPPGKTSLHYITNMFSAYCIHT